MKKSVLIFIAILALSHAQARDPLTLGNDAWPPFIIEGSEQGTSEKLVCQALERSGWPCSIQVKDWDEVLSEASAGTLDGIAAAWRNPEREEFLLFSEPYLTNRIVPVVRGEDGAAIESVSDLAGLRVALVSNYAYGEEIMAMAGEFEVIPARNSLDAIGFVRDGRADTALVDELVARDFQEKSRFEGLAAADVILAFRDLHFAVSRQHPQATEIIADFQSAYQLMLADGTVNEILNVDWLATDFGQTGQLNVVLRSGVSLDSLAPPSNDGEVFALEASEYDLLQQRDLDPSRVNYQVEGKSYSTLQSAMDEVFGKDAVCKHKNFTSQFDCTDIFKKR